ncbi:hypothetical protein [Nocardia sp. NPDC005366]|uniref:hypothetical protein n=1 Tax=Nocardia sp. NPDC005366 TaxID=3156878 RepID=UPI0033A3CB02
MMLVYATPADLTGRLDPIPNDATALIESASILVRDHTVNDLYAITPAGLPSNPDQREAVREATCLQVTAWTKARITPAAGGLRAEVTSQTVDGGSVAYRLPEPAAIQQAAQRLCHEAVLVLRNAGLASGRPLIC